MSEIHPSSRNWRIIASMNGNPVLPYQDNMMKNQVKKHALFKL